MPQTISKSYEVFTLSELSEKAKEKVCDQYRDEYEFEMDEEVLIEMLKQRYSNIHDMEIRYSGFYSQGDGASFTGTLDSDWIIKESGFVSEELQDLIGHVDCTFERGLSRYVHENTCSTELNTIPSSFEENSCSGDGVEEALHAIVECYRKSVCHIIYTELENHYNHCTSDEIILENFMDRDDTLFFEDGTIFDK